MSLCCADGVSALSAASSVVFSSPTLTLSSTGTVILLPLVALTCIVVGAMVVRCKDHVDAPRDVVKSGEVVLQI